MRLLIGLRCIESCPYEMQYHYHLQGFIYSLLQGSKYQHIHDKTGYKFFCFSNIFPPKDLLKDDQRVLIISSPDREFIECLYGKLHLFLNSNVQINIGSMRFRIGSIEKLVIRIPDNLPFTLITGTPIIVRVPKKKYMSYGLKPKKDYEYIYWRFGYPVDLFFYQIENNLLRKYREFRTYGNLPDDRSDSTRQSSFHSSIIQKFKLKKQISTRLVMKGKEEIVIGTTWEFEFDTNSRKNLIEFGLESGFGERNSLGFGFINLIR